MLQPPTEVVEVVAAFDVRSDTFDVHDVHYAITRSIERETIPNGQSRGYWAEMAAFGFDMHPAPDGGPWKTYFQPAMTFTANDGALVFGPDIAEADSETVEYWMARAKSVKHPILAARYGDLVWDFSKHVTGKKPDIEFARLAIDSYIDALRMDNGDAWGDNHYNVGRVLQLALSIQDVERVARAVETIIDYAERTCEDDKPGTYCYLFDQLLPSKKGPSLSAEQEQSIVEMFEEKFGAMVVPGGPYDVDPHTPRDIGVRLAAYYKRKGREEDRKRVLEEIARAFERRANMGDAMSGLIFREDARSFFLEAGRRDEAERMQRESQEVAPKAQESMARQSFSFEIPDDHRQKFLDMLLAEGIEKGILCWAVSFIPGQDDLRQQMEELAKKYPLQAMFAPTVLGDEGIKAEVKDTVGDPDGPMVWETSKRMGLDGPWLSWGLDHLIENGLTAERFADFIAESPVFPDERIPLIHRGISAHMIGDYVQAIHILLPQIERALVGLVYLLGGASTKPHRSGRGVVQSKSLNDALADEATRKTLGPDLTIYLAAVLSHPKGLNVRNEVCHGLWGPDAFTKQMSERVIHALAAVSLLRAKPKGDSTSGEAQSEEKAAQDGPSEGPISAD